MWIIDLQAGLWSIAVAKPGALLWIIDLPEGGLAVLVLEVQQLTYFSNLELLWKHENNGGRGGGRTASRGRKEIRFRVQTPGKNRVGIYLHLHLPE